MVAVRSGKAVHPVEQFTGTSLRGVGDDGALKHFVQFNDHVEQHLLRKSLVLFEVFRVPFADGAEHVHDFKPLQVKGVAWPFEQHRSKALRFFQVLSVFFSWQVVGHNLPQVVQDLSVPNSESQEYSDALVLAEEWSVRRTRNGPSKRLGLAQESQVNARLEAPCVQMAHQRARRKVGPAALSERTAP